ncbi:MAG: 4-(cytidine 5'-diphospho)-2-C-methyl-D-erythritol kinase [Chthonomonadaceae bacterium]|nr:4-(cytidine 5'-diphospho)-2-C-methyl-D-erythritol kinase [Chthonomonadaceae bacterium]
MTLTCPAKINLFLSVGQQDGRGYHPIRTAFQAVSLCDTLIVEPSEQDEFTCNDPSVPKDNTVTKAWRLVLEHVSLPKLAVTLSKAIPSQAGLGGGSSDAAGMLRAAMKLSRGQLGDREAHEIACAIGADVPFFLTGGLALAEGYGEALQPIPDEPRQSIWILVPPVGVSTAVAYRALDSSPRALFEIPPNPFHGPNDFLTVAPPESAWAVDWLYKNGATFASLSGSGSAAFGVMPPDAATQGHAETEELEGLNGPYKLIKCMTITREQSLWTS